MFKRLFKNIKERFLLSQRESQEEWPEAPEAETPKEEYAMLINEEMTDIIPATMLILVVDDELKYKEGGMAWVRIGAKHWLQDLFSRFQGKTRWIELPLPSDKEMPGWIQREAERQGGAFDNHAAAVLARFVGRDLFQARQEISKAISYVGNGGQVSAKEVHLLNASSREESIFSLVDAIGQRDRRQAMKYYYHLHSGSKSQPSTQPYASQPEGKFFAHSYRWGAHKD